MGWQPALGGSHKNILRFRLTCKYDISYIYPRQPHRGAVAR